MGSFFKLAKRFWRYLNFSAPKNGDLLDKQSEKTLTYRTASIIRIGWITKI